MEGMSRKAGQGTTTFLLAAAFSLVAAGQGLVLPDDLPVLSAPILITTCGQNAGATLVGTVCDRLGIPYHVDPFLLMGDLGAVCCSDAGCPFGGALLITTGASSEGMSAREVDMTLEIARCTALLERARELGMFIIVAQVEGPAWPSTEDDERSIRSVLPFADLLITRADIDHDGYFAALAEELEIPQVYIDGAPDLEALLLLLFRAPG